MFYIISDIVTGSNSQPCSSVFVWFQSCFLFPVAPSPHCNALKSNTSSKYKNMWHCIFAVFSYLRLFLRSIFFHTISCTEAFSVTVFPNPINNSFKAPMVYNEQDAKEKTEKFRQQEYFWELYFFNVSQDLKTIFERKWNKDIGHWAVIKTMIRKTKMDELNFRSMKWNAF